jgi:general secretion pathway protein I
MKGRAHGGRGRSGRLAGGFTLLEVMIALAILASTLVVLLEIITNNVRATNHAKLTTTATFLARGKMVDIEDDILENGFIDSDDSASGDFKEQNLPGFRWESLVERIDLPTDMTQKAQQQATDTTQSAQSSKDPMQALTGMVGGLMGTFMEPIRLALQESIRRVTVKIYWDEPGRPNQMVDVVTFLTDPAKMDQTFMSAQAGTAGAGGAQPSTGTAVGASPTQTVPGFGAIK